MAKKKKDNKALRPGVLIAGAVGLVLVLAFAGINFLSGRGGDELDTASTSPSPAAAAQSAPSAPKATPAPSASTTKEVGLFEGRDPFKPLVSQAQAPAAVQAAVVATLPPTVAPVPSAATEVVVEVLEVVEDASATTVKVGEAVHRMAKPGDKLSSDVTVDKIDGSCVEMHKGDTEFRLCVGESATK
jgi:hypothetical protein